METNFGSEENDSGAGITVDSAGNVVIVGSKTWGIKGFTNLGVWNDVFIVKYNSSGEKKWNTGNNCYNVS